MQKRIIYVLFTLILISSSVFGELAITEPEDIYNLGDKLYVTATGLKGYENGNLNIDLDCGNTTVNLLKISARAFPVDGGQSYSIPFKYLSERDLEISDISSIVGECSINANLAEEVVTSKRFTISDEAIVTASLDKVRYNPNEDATLTITATRADGIPFSGSFVTDNFTVASGDITNEDKGKITKKITIPGNQEPGSYFLEVTVFDVDSEGDMLNSGTVNVFLTVNQVPTNLDPTLSHESIEPDKEITFSPKITDQVGSQMPGLINFYLTDPEEGKYDFSTESGVPVSFSLPTNATKGTWTVYFLHDTMTSEATFEVLGFERINYTLTSSVLTIQNIGNVEYIGIVDFNIGDSVEEVEVRLGIGESRDYILEAPEGEYEISVDDGTNKYSGSSFLTGNAVKVKERGNVLPGKVSLMWIFLVFLGGSLIVIMVGMYKRPRTGTKSSFLQKLKGKSTSNENFTSVNKSSGPSVQNSSGQTISQGQPQAESSVVVDGQKVESTVVSIKLKEKDAFSEEIQHELVQIIRRNCGHKGVVDVKGDYIYLIYSPLISRSYRNERFAAKAAVNISEQLLSYTKNLKGELKFGIGVNTGDLVSQKVGVKLRYTSMGTTITFANRMAEQAENNVLVSDHVRRHLLRDAITKKVDTIHNHSVYSVTMLKDRTADQARLKDLLSRMSDS